MKTLGPIRSVLWPIYRHEWAKFIPMFCMLFLIGFNYSVIRNLKDTVVITAKFSGAEIIPFIKVYAMFPMAIVFTLFYAKLSSRWSQERVFYIVIGTFLLFFSLFIYILYPLRDSIHPIAWADQFEQIAPTGFRGLIAMVRYWSFTVFYVMAECWGNIVLSLLFWGFANHITSVEESGRFYGHLNIASNIAGAIAGQVANTFSQGRTWDQALLNLMNVILVAGLAILGIFYWMNRRVLNKPEYAHLHEAGQGKIEKKKKMRLRESLRYIASSRYLTYIAVLVLAYNMCINLVEVVWKDQLRTLYPDSLQFNTYMNNLTTIFCIISTIQAFFLARFLRRFGWTTIALLTPLTMLMTGLAFFGFLLYRPELERMMVPGYSALGMLVFCGAIQVILSKAAKYSIFDTTKEMAFIPLSTQSKMQGKAAIDGIGSRLGKSGGSFVHQGLLLVFGTLSASAPFVGAIVLGIIVLWIVATQFLGREYREYVQEQIPSSIPETPSTIPEGAPS